MKSSNNVAAFCGTLPESLDELGRLLTVKQAADAAGVHEATIYRSLKSGRLTGYRFGQRSVRVREGDLIALLTPVTG